MQSMRCGRERENGFDGQVGRNGDNVVLREMVGE